MLAIEGWTLSATWMSSDAAQSSNAVGSGNRLELHSQPSQVLGLFQSVSTERLSRDTPLASNCGRIVLLVVRGRVRVVLGEPGAEGRFRQQRGGAGELLQVLEGAFVILAVAEQVAVLDVACRAVGDPAGRGPHRGLGVVEQVPAGLVEQASCHLRNVCRAGGAGLAARAGRRCGVAAVGGVVGADVAAERIGGQERRGGRAHRADRDVVDVDVAVVAAFAVEGDRVRARCEGHRHGDGGPRVPARGRRQGDLGGGAVDDQALGARFEIAIASGVIGVADGHVRVPGRGAEYLPRSVRPGGGQPGDEPGRAEVVLVVVRDRGPAAERRRARLAGLAEGALPFPGGRHAGGRSRRQRAEELHLRVDGGERARADLVAQGHLAGGDRQPAAGHAAGV